MATLDDLCRTFALAMDLDAAKVGGWADTLADAGRVTHDRVTESDAAVLLLAILSSERDGDLVEAADVFGSLPLCDDQLTLGAGLELAISECPGAVQLAVGEVDTLPFDQLLTVVGSRLGPVPQALIFAARDIQGGACGRIRFVGPSVIAALSEVCCGPVTKPHLLTEAALSPLLNRKTSSPDRAPPPH